MSRPYVCWHTKNTLSKSIAVLITSAIFAVAMGYFEAVVVVYLRTILTRRPDWKIIEITREAATLVMLVAFAVVAGRNVRERIGVFMWIFGIWDIVYYIGLWTWLRWPESLLTMDTLFYIPCTWASPVYVPVLFALTMMFLGTLLVLNRGVSVMRTSGLWALIGWFIGLTAGILNAVYQGLPASAPAMGLSLCLSFASGGAGAGFAIARDLKKTRLPLMFALACLGGVVGGLLGHLARSMFYKSLSSILWPMGVGVLIGFAASVLTAFTAGKKEVEHVTDQ